jgi:hypothetical protein
MVLNRFQNIYDFATEYLDILKFFTTWVLILLITHHHTKDVFNLVFLATVVAAAGSYISFVKPKQYVFRFGKKEYTVDGTLRLITVDLLFHLIMLIFVIETYGTYYSLFSYQTANAILLCVFYYLTFNIYRIYGIDKKDFLFIYTMICITYLVLVVTLGLF